MRMNITLTINNFKSNLGKVGKGDATMSIAHNTSLFLYIIISLINSSGSFSTIIGRKIIMINYIKEVSDVKKARLWNDMQTRCYNKKFHERQPQYKECKICDEWLNDKNLFFKWVDDNYYIVGDEQIDLDKDILVKGNKIYSPETCVFVPHSINTLFINGKKRRGDCPLGVHFDNGKNKYRACLAINKTNIKLNWHHTQEKAFEEYKRHKEALIITTADKYKGIIPSHLYNAMLNWEIEKTD